MERSNMWKIERPYTLLIFCGEIKVSNSHLGLMECCVQEQARYIPKWIVDDTDLKWPTPHNMSSGVPELEEGEDGEDDSDNEVHDLYETDSSDDSLDCNKSEQYDDESQVSEEDCDERELSDEDSNDA